MLLRRTAAVLLTTCLLARSELTPPHPACAQDITSYQAKYVKSTFNASRQLGVPYYELGFRDLYPASPICDCQRSVRSINSTGPPLVLDEMFTLSCGYGTKHRTLYRNPMQEAALAAAAVWNQTVVASKLPGLSKVHFTTAVLAFKEQEGNAASPTSPYRWYIEFQCGTDTLPHLFSGGFVGLNMYSLSTAASEQGMADLAEMEAAVTSLGLGWVMDSWGIGYHHANTNTSGCEYP